VLFIFSGAVCCGATEDAQHTVQWTEESWKIEMEALQKIRKGLLLFPTEQELAFVASRMSLDQAELALEKAVEDIAAHIPFLLFIRSKFDAIAHLAWAIPIAEKLPSQPVAVVQLMTIVNDIFDYFDVTDHMCPRMVIEDAIPFQQYKNLMERSVLALESFAMKDAKAEEVRERCLLKIKDTLATAKPWQKDEDFMQE
jgi:hypothetical protein